MNITEPQYNHTYTLSVDLSATNRADGVDLTHLITSTLSKGSSAGFYAEGAVAHQLREHAYREDGTYHDMRWRADDRPIEVKSLTRHGIKFCRSSHVGAGRRVDPEMFLAEAPERDFIAVDTTSLATEGRIDYVILRGEEVARMGHSLGYTKARSLLF